MVEIVIPKYAAPGRPWGIIPPSPPRETARREEAAWRKMFRTYTGRLPASMEEIRAYMRGTGNMNGMVSSGIGNMAASFGPMGSSNPLASLTDASCYWKFEDTSDASGNGNTLTAVNSPTFNTGKVANAAYTVQNGATKAYYTAADSSSLNPGAGVSFSIAFWGYINVFSNQAIFVDRGVFASDDPFNFYKASNGHFVVGWGETGVQSSGFDTTATVNDATWYWYCLTVVPGSNGPAFLYQDNSQIATLATGTVSGSTGTATTYVGRRGNVSNFPTTLDVRIDEFGLWKRVITSGERSLLWNSGNGATVYP